MAIPVSRQHSASRESGTPADWLGRYSENWLVARRFGSRRGSGKSSTITWGSSRKTLSSQERATNDRLFRVSDLQGRVGRLDRKSTRLNSSHVRISYAGFCLKK